MSLVNQSWSACAGDDKVLVLTATTKGDVTGDTYEFDLVDGSGALKVRKTSADGITTATTYAVVEVDLTDALELSAGMYTWQLRRTNTGFEDTLAQGDLSLGASYRDLVVT